MKKIFLGFSAAIALASVNTAVASQGDEQVKYKCMPFQDENGHVLVGVASPAIVSLPGDFSGGKLLYVRTLALSPNAVPKYHRLKKVSQHMEGSVYTSKEFEVHIFYMAGMRAHIQKKGSDITSSCVQLAR